MSSALRQSAESPAMLERVEILDEVLHAHAAVLGKDYVSYGNHAYRVLNFCLALSDRAEETVQKVAIAAAFHDIGIWTEDTFDYLLPSVVRAGEYLSSIGKQAWAPEIDCMILQHHKVLRYSNSAERLVEPFRQADWIDVTAGLRTFGLPRPLIRRAYAIWPDAGFHRFLIAQTFGRVRTHPFSPLPMMRI